MGVDIQLYLPADTRVSDVATVMGAVAGLPLSRWGGADWHAARVVGARAAPTSEAAMARIILDGDMVDGAKNHETLYHFESPGGSRCMIPRSTAFWIAVGRRLVDFFGGYLDYNDSDDSPCDYARMKPRPSNSPDDDTPWREFQDEILALQPITKAELQEAEQFAAYRTAWAGWSS